MNKITRRDYWAFCTGMAAAGLLFALVLHSSTLFLINGLVGMYDVYMWLAEVNKPKVTEDYE